MKSQTLSFDKLRMRVGEKEEVKYDRYCTYNRYR
jgi:hypothetical protein